MNLYEKMFAVMNESEAVEKSMVVGSGNNSYKAVSEAAMLNLVKPLFKKYKLIIFPIDGDINEIVNVYNKTDKYKSTIEESQRAITQLKVTFRIMDTESKEFQDVVGFGNGADSQDKGAGKSFTYSLKNALSKTFMLFSGEDTDNEHSDDIGKDKPSKADEKAEKEMEALKLKPISEQKCGIITKMIKDAKVDTVQFLEHYKINSLAEITNEMLPGIIKKLQTTIDAPSKP